MKKILLFTVLSFLLVSCGKQEWQKIDSGATMTGREMPWIDQSWSVISGDDAAKDPDTSVSSNNSTGVSQGNSWEAGSPAANGKSEDQIVKDFEKDLDGILNSIDNGSQKK